MGGGHIDTVLRHLRRLVGLPGAGGDEGDGALLARFLDRHDEEAFAALVARHGPMVWGACRRLLPDANDAEDAFQATFLVLVRKARSLDRAGSLAGWLHAVARRVALRARSRRGRERPLTEEVPAMNATSPPAAAERREAEAVLDEELRRLPEKYRGPLLLCDVQGRSHEEAARQLGCPAGSMSWRLARGRELLRRGLVRRGVVLTAAGLTALLAERAAPAVPAALAEAALKAALLVAAGKGAASASVAALVEGTLRALAVAKAKAVAALLALGLLVAGAGAVAHHAFTAAPSPLPHEGEENGGGREPVAQAPEPLPPPVVQEEPPPPAKPPEVKPGPRFDVHGDPLPPGAVARLGTIRLRQAGEISALAFSADGKRLATGGDKDDPYLHVWDTETGQLVGRLAARGVAALAFSPDGKLLAVAPEPIGNRPQPLLLWDLNAPKGLRNVGSGCNDTQSVQFMPDGKAVVVVEEKGLSAYNVKIGVPVKGLSGEFPDARAFAVSPDGRSFAVSEAGEKKAVVVVTGARRFTFEKEGKLATALAYSADGKRLAVGIDGSLVILDAATGKVLKTATDPSDYNILAVTFCRDRREVTALDRIGQVRVWDEATGKLLHKTKPGPDEWLLHGLLSPDGKLAALVDGRPAQYGHTVRLLDLPAGKDRFQVGGHEADIRAIAFAPDGKRLAASGGDGVTLLWDVPAAREVWRRGNPRYRGTGVAFSPDGKSLAAAGDTGDVELFDPASGKSQRTLGLSAKTCRRLAFSPGGEALAVTESNGHVRLAFLRGGGSTLPITDGPAEARGAAFSPDGKLIATACYGGARLYDGVRGAHLRTLAVGSGGATGVAFSPDGKLLAVASADSSTVHLIDVSTGESLRAVSGDEPIRCVTFSPAGGIVVAGGSKGHVTFWDAGTGKVLWHLTGHEGAVNALAFAPDGRTLASAGADTTVLLWNMDVVWSEFAGMKPRPPVSKDALWAELGDPDELIAGRAAALLLTDPDGAVALLKERLKPVPPESDGQLRKALADLRDEDYKVRDRALGELRRLGPEAVPALLELQRTTSDDKLRLRIHAFLTLEELDGHIVPGKPEPRAVRVLERIGTPAARALLEALAKGAPTARRTIEAKAALARLATQ